MKKIMKHMLCMLSVFSMFLSMLTSSRMGAYATGNVETISEEEVARHISEICEVPSEGTTYRVWNKAGQEVTVSFKTIAQGYINANDMKGLYDYFVNEIDYMEKTTEVWSMARSDLAKTWTTAIVKSGTYDPTNPDPLIPMPVTVSFECDLRGTIYYDPNTMRITSTSGPYQVGAVRKTDGSGTAEAITYRYASPSTRVSIASNRLSSDFYFSMHITGYFSGYDRYYDFGYLGGNGPVYTSRVS